MESKKRGRPKTRPDIREDDRKRQKKFRL